MIQKAKVIAMAVLLVAVYCTGGYGQAPPATIIQIETANQTRYIHDTSDLSTFATVQSPTNVTLPTFATWVTEADIVAVNGKPAKGVYLTRQVAINLSPTPPPGQGIADLAATNIVDRILVLMQPDGTTVGSIMMLGLDGGTPPPGAPAAASRGSNFAISGGTGAFLGVRGQLGMGPPLDGSPPVRNASVKEDPSKRRINGGGRAIFVLHLIPMSVPQVVTTANGPAVTHSSDFSLVTASKPAAAGEILSLFVTGLGPTVPSVDPGQPFPASPPAVVNSPVSVTVNGESAEVIAAVGFRGAIDGYQVNFRVPSDAAKGTAGVQVSAAWIAGPAVNITIQ